MEGIYYSKMTGKFFEAKYTSKKRLKLRLRYNDGTKPPRTSISTWAFELQMYPFDFYELVVSYSEMDIHHFFTDIKDLRELRFWRTHEQD